MTVLTETRLRAAYHRPDHGVDVRAAASRGQHPEAHGFPGVASHRPLGEPSVAEQRFADAAARSNSDLVGRQGSSIGRQRSSPPGQRSHHRLGTGQLVAGTLGPMPLADPAGQLAS
jgi:hypothetical protein